MGIPVKEILQQLPKERQNKIKEESKKLIRQYQSLQDFRKAMGMTQDELAAELLQTQVNISKLENKIQILEKENSLWGITLRHSEKISRVFSISLPSISSKRA